MDCGPGEISKEKSLIGKPVPLSGIVCGLPSASSLITSVAVRSPAADGVKVIVIAHVAPAPRGAARQLSVAAKSPALEPLIVTPPANVTGAIAVFVTVIIDGGLVVPTSC